MLLFCCSQYIFENFFSQDYYIEFFDKGIHSKEILYQELLLRNKTQIISIYIKKVKE